MIKVRNKVFARKKRQPNNENCKRLYNILRNRVNRELKKSKKQYYADYFASNINNTKKTWDGIREIVNLKKKLCTKAYILFLRKAIYDFVTNLDSEKQFNSLCSGINHRDDKCIN